MKKKKESKQNLKPQMNPSNDRDKMIEASRMNQKLQQLLNKKDFFLNEIEQNRQQLPQAKPFEELDLVETEDKALEGRDFTICIRARPLLQHELDANFFEIITANNPNLTLHQTKFNVKGQAVVENSNFNVDMAFGPKDNNDIIYEQTGRPLVKLALTGGVGAMFAYGQTGSGKTFTMQGIQQRISKEIFKYNKENHEIHVGFFQLLGNKATDLLIPEQKVEIMEDKFGKIQTNGLQEVQVHQENEFLDLVNQAQANRKTQATFKNEVSSRTHSICQVRVNNQKVPSAENGYIYLIDLVGSENASDSQFHDKTQFNETKDINKSLMALKECIRNRALASAEDKYIHVPFRQSKLTLLLKDSFDMDTFRQSKTVVIANIAPSLADLAQTYNTLRYAAPIKVSTKAKKTQEINPNNPQFWDNPTLKEYMRKVCWKYYKKVKVDMDQFLPFETGKQALNMNEADFIQKLVDLGYPEKSGKQVHDQFYKKFIDNRFADRKKLQQKIGKLVQPEMQFHGSVEQQQPQQQEKEKPKKKVTSVNASFDQKAAGGPISNINSNNTNNNNSLHQEILSPKKRQDLVPSNKIKELRQEGSVDNLENINRQQQDSSRKQYSFNLQKKSSLAQQGQNIVFQPNVLQQQQQQQQQQNHHEKQDLPPLPHRNSSNYSNENQINQIDMKKMPINSIKQLKERKMLEKQKSLQQEQQQQNPQNGNKKELAGFSMDTLEEQEHKYQEYKKKQQLHDVKEARQNQVYLDHMQQHNTDRQQEQKQKIQNYREKVNNFQQEINGRQTDFEQQQKPPQMYQMGQQQQQQQSQNPRGKWSDKPNQNQYFNQNQQNLQQHQPQQQQQQQQQNKKYTNFDETLSYHYRKDFHNNQVNHKGNNYYPSIHNNNNSSNNSNSNKNNINMNGFGNIVEQNNSQHHHVQNQNLAQNQNLLNYQQQQQLTNKAVSQQILNNNNFHFPQQQQQQKPIQQQPAQQDNHVLQSLNNAEQRQLYQQFMRQQQQIQQSLNQNQNQNMYDFHPSNAQQSQQSQLFNNNGSNHHVYGQQSQQPQNNNINMAQQQYQQQQQSQQQQFYF